MQMTEMEQNKTAVRESFDRWRAGTGSPFELLAPDAQWTIAGSSPLSRTYSRKDFLEIVIAPFNARMKERLIPTVKGIYSDGDMVIIHFDAAAVAKDDQPYENSYTWYFRMREAKVTEAVAFFDTRHFDDLWARVPPEGATQP